MRHAHRRNSGTRQIAAALVELLEQRRLLVAIASGQTMAGTLSVLGQVDEYTFSANTGDAIVVALGETTAAIEPRLRIISPAGGTLFDQAAGFGLDTDLAAPETGTYTLRVSDGGDDETGSYAISLAKLPGPQVSDGDDGAITSGQPVVGNLGLGDLDIFTFSATAGEELRIAFAELAALLEPRLDVFSPSGTSVFSQSAAFGVDATFTTTQTGTYYAVVRDSGADEAGDYRITVARPLDPAVSMPLLNGRPVPLTLPRGHLQMLTFTVPIAGANVRIALSETTTPAVESRIDVYSPTGALVATETTGFGLDVDFAASTAGQYVAVVGDAGADEDGSYNITAAIGGAAPSLDRGPLVSGQRSRRVIDVGALDVYSFSGNAGDSVVVALGELSGLLEPRLDVFGPSGQVVVSQTATFGMDLNVVLPASGAYLAVVADAEADESGFYHFSFARVPAAHQVGPQLGDQEGGAIQSGQRKEGYLDVADLDVYTFSANAGDRILAALAEISALLEPKLDIYRPDGALLATDQSTLAAVVEAQAPIGGAYTLVVRDSGADEAGYYAVSLATSSPTPAADPLDPDAGMLASGQTRFGSWTAGDSDIYSFDATAGSSFTLRLAERNTGVLEPNLILYLPDGTRQSASSTTEAVLIVASAPVSGTYTVVAIDGGMEDAGGYAISLDAVPGADTAAPVALAGEYEYLRSGNVLVHFSEPVTNLVATNLALHNTTTGGMFVGTSVTFSAATNTATYTVTGGLPEGNYNATLTAAATQDLAGNPLAGGLMFDFFVLRGDANRDRTVNLRDFNILASNFGAPAQSFADGNFNYDASVNLADFNLLASRFGMSVAPASSAPGGLFGDRRIAESDDRRDEVAELLA